MVAAHAVGGIDFAGARLHGETYLVRFPLVCQSLELRCRCSKIMSPPNCNQTLSPWRDGDSESEGVPTGESD